MDLLCDLLVQTMIHQGKGLLLIDLLHSFGELVVTKVSLRWHGRDVHLVSPLPLMGAIWDDLSWLVGRIVEGHLMIALPGSGCTLG